MAAKRILIVEDNEMSRDALSRRLDSRGYDVCVAADGLEGFRVARTSVPDMILMDLGLPEIDGCECARRLRAEPVTKAIPIIALTAHATEGAGWLGHQHREASLGRRRCPQA